MEKTALIIILLLGAFLRLYHIDRYMTFLGDEGRDAIVMKNIVTFKHFPLIGPGTSIGNMYLGPLYYYLVAPSLWLSGLNPVGPAIFVALLGLATVALLWWIGRQWFSPAVSLAVSFLYAISPTVITYSRSSWNPNVMPFFALLAMYGVWKVWRHGSWGWLVVSAVSFAVVLNSHYLGLLLIPTIIIFLLLSPKNLNTRKSILISLSAISILISPLIVFDLRHNWQNFSAVKTFFSDRQTTVNLKAYKAIPNLWPIWQDITTSLIAGKNVLAGKIVAFGIFDLLVLYVAKKRFSRDFWFVFSWAGFGVLGLGLYKQHIYDHYYGFIFPAVFLLFGFVLEKLFKNRILRIVTLIATLLLVFVNFQTNPLRYSPNNQLEYTRRAADLIKAQSDGQSFNLALLAKSNYDASYRYFLQTNQAVYYTIHEKLADQLFVICEQSNCEPINNSLWEIAAFGWAKIDNQWTLPSGAKLYKLVHNPTGL